MCNFYLCSKPSSADKLLRGCLPLRCSSTVSLALTGSHPELFQIIEGWGGGGPGEG